jgi:hypothetical protein
MVNSIKSRPLQSCSQYCVLPWELPAHNSLCTPNWGGYHQEARFQGFFLVWRIWAGWLDWW